MMISKKRARGWRMRANKICGFHEINPDQEAVMFSCHDCKFIQDTCGCDLESCCEFCEPRRFVKVEAELRK